MRLQRDCGQLLVADLDSGRLVAGVEISLGPKPGLGGRRRDELDHGLPQLIDAINARMAALAQLRTDEALARLALKDRVRFANTAKPQYLRGATGEIDEFYGDAVVVCLDTPVGRFASGHVRCSPELLERIEGT